MRLLLDTHALLWALEDSPKLSKKARTLIVDRRNEVIVSAASAWEIAIKRSLGRLEAPNELERAVRACGFAPLAIDFASTERLAELPPHHADPFDRLLVAQCLVEDAKLVTKDKELRRYGVETVW